VGPWRPGRPAQILLVEDSPTDAMMVREILGQADAPSTLHVVEDGLEAIAFLRREDGYDGAPRPDLILLDLKLPRKSGQEVLADIKADERLRTIPVVVLTSSHDQHDVVDAYRHHANSYVTKPVDYAHFAEAVRQIERFWLELATLAEGT
jgi:CheY-like chemotaxis protein